MTDGVARIDHGAERKSIGHALTIFATALHYLAIAGVSPSHEAEDEEVVPGVRQFCFPYITMFLMDADLFRPMAGVQYADILDETNRRSFGGLLSKLV